MTNHCQHLKEDTIEPGAAEDECVEEATKGAANQGSHLIDHSVVTNWY